jgi:LPXTG-motif cell wall-anchored protein
MLAPQTFTCTDAAVIRDDTPPVTLEDIPTETGGLLPDTATDNYNYLAIGAGLALLGFAGLLRRKSIKN